MYKCPECNEDMTWGSDEQLANEVVSQYYCKECKIELNKIVTLEEN